GGGVFGPPRLSRCMKTGRWRAAQPRGASIALLSSRLSFNDRELLGQFLQRFVRGSWLMDRWPFGRPHKKIDDNLKLFFYQHDMPPWHALHQKCRGSATRVRMTEGHDAFAYTHTKKKLGVRVTKPPPSINPLFLSSAYAGIFNNAAPPCTMNQTLL
ncbi:unnamed protein product, partial [Ectocarpus sp. 12 AP-2014]